MSRRDGTISSREILEHINLARYSAVLAQSFRKPRVNRGDTSPAPASRFDPFQRVVEMHLIERAFGQIHDLQRRLEIAGGETAFRWPAIGRPPRRVSHEHGAPDGHPNLKPRQPR